MNMKIFQGITAAVLLAGLALSQPPSTFKVRLSLVAIDATMRATVAGDGVASATLNGSKLTVTGTFEGLKSAATIAQIHRGVATGVRGPSILDLTVSKAGAGTSGTISGTFELTPAQTTSLRRGELYIQIHSEKAPDGNLWGWLLP
jgi:hypothetical protein